jgi:hypothetical protein
MQLAERVRLWLQPFRSQAQPEDVFRSLWMKTARADSTRHPFHREVLTNLDRLIAEAAGAPPDTLVEVNGVPTRWNDMPQRYPHISRRLTPDWMRNFVVTEVARVAAVADSTDYLTNAHRPGSRTGPRKRSRSSTGLPACVPPSSGTTEKRSDGCSPSRTAFAPSIQTDTGPMKESRPSTRGQASGSPRGSISARQTSNLASAGVLRH